PSASSAQADSRSRQGLATPVAQDHLRLQGGGSAAPVSIRKRVRSRSHRKSALGEQQEGALCGALSRLRNGSAASPFTNLLHVKSQQENDRTRHISERGPR